MIRALNSLKARAAVTEEVKLSMIGPHRLAIEVATLKRVRGLTLNSRIYRSPREIPAGEKVRSLSVSGVGTFATASADAAIRAAFFSQTADNWSVAIPGYGGVTGPFLVAALEYAGESEGEATYAMTLASASDLRSATP